MQTTIALPEAGKTYQSAKFPGYIIHAQKVEQTPERFFVHAIDKSANAIDNQIFLLWQEEWEKGDFRPAPDHL